MKTFNKFTRVLAFTTAVLVVQAALISSAHAYLFTTSKVELLYGSDFARGTDFADADEGVFTFANATGWKWGDSFLFFDTANFDDNLGDPGSTHLEWGVRYRFSKGGGPIKGVFGMVQLDWDSGRFANKITRMAGVSADWNVPGFRFVKTNILLRDDPEFDGSSVQFTLVWNKGFKIGEQNFSFEGFADWTASEGKKSAAPFGGYSESNLLTQPQLLWHPTKNFGVGIEYQYWQNRIGEKDVDEKVPQIMGRWTF